MTQRKISAKWYISPRGRLIEVTRGTHIEQVAFEPRTFGLTKQEVDRIYRKHHEECYVERWARQEIMLGLMKKGWIRVLIDKNNYVNFELAYTMDRHVNNIFVMLEHIKKIVGKRKYRRMGLRVIQSGCCLVHKYDMSGEDNFIEEMGK
ncbi:MAG TPA: hypothetical protein DET40_25130 [Lentisphaeria bacterium]|nr:MAG: hypothetical protein A2X45_18830 [Lentisphaerae bacterium GWF2_50_93]HCE46844.1 hypothetical protein [Lentisphaeria bacterium]